MIQAILLFVLGFVLLIKGGDWFVDGATGIAKRFGIPDILIGATVVSIGTTLPEAMVSASSAASGLGDMAYGAAIGSIICNTALIAGLTIAIKPGKVDRNSLKKPIAFFFVAAACYLAIAYGFGFFYRWTGFLLLGIFVAYMVVLVLEARKEMAKASASQANPVAGEAVAAVAGEAATTVLGEAATAVLGESSANVSGEFEATEIGEHGADVSEGTASKVDSEKERALWLNIALLIIGAALVAVGARLLIDNGTYIATELGVPQTVIALTFVALGTSLPELVTAISALAKGHGALSLGNIIGADLFNLVFVSGVAMTINPFKVPTEKLLGGMNASLVLDIPLMVLVMVILTVPTLIKGKLSRWQGFLLLALYAGYCIFQFS